MNRIIQVFRDTDDARMLHWRETGERLGVNPPCNLGCSARNEPSQEHEFVLQRSKTSSRVTRKPDAQPLAFMLNPYEPPLSSAVVVAVPTIGATTKIQRVRAAFMLAIGSVVGLNVSVAVIRRQVLAIYYAPAPVRFAAGVLMAVSSYQILLYAERTGYVYAIKFSMTLPPNWLSCLKRPAW